MDASAIKEGFGRHQDPGPGSTRRPQRPREVVLPESGSTVARSFPTTTKRRLPVESVRTGPGSTRRPRKITREEGVRFSNPRRTVRTRRTVAKCLRVSVACNKLPRMACNCDAHPLNVLLSLLVLVLSQLGQSRGHALLPRLFSVPPRPRFAVLPKLPACPVRRGC